MIFFNDLKNHFQQRNSFFFQQAKFEKKFNEFIAIAIR